MGDAGQERRNDRGIHCDRDDPVPGVHQPAAYAFRVEALPDLYAFIARFSDNRGWDTEMKDRLSAVAEETRRLVVLASSEGPVADLEFIGGGDEENLEDRIRQLQ